jgi:hypothetical protein
MMLKMSKYLTPPYERASKQCLLFKKSKLEEGLQEFSANIVKQSTNNGGWKEAGDQFGVGLEANNILECTPVNWSILNLGVGTSDRMYLFTYQNGQDNNEDQNFF